MSESVTVVYVVAREHDVVVGGVAERGSATSVHCYGHGGAGVTLSWGCAEEVVMMIGSA